ncbi:MAG: DNA repair helicase [Siphoviridae sp. ctjeG17]|nr:MAG: DNA repair helicase [Siphoviridae sp. ctjeG17]
MVLQICQRCGTRYEYIRNKSTMHSCEMCVTNLKNQTKRW